MLHENVTDQHKDKEKVINTLGELQYYKDCNEFGEAGKTCEYCIQDFDYPPSDEYYDMSTVVIELTYQKHDE